jgi:hypothetical protein
VCCHFFLAGTNQIQLTLNETFLKGLSNDAIKELAKKNTGAELQNISIGPLETFAGSDIPHTVVSSVYQYFIKFMCASEVQYSSKQ